MKLWGISAKVDDLSLSSRGTNIACLRKLVNETFAKHTILLTSVSQRPSAEAETSGSDSNFNPQNTFFYFVFALLYKVDVFLVVEISASPALGRDLVT